MKTTLTVLLCAIIAAFLAGCGGSPVDKALNKVDASIKKMEKMTANNAKISKEELDALSKEMEEPVAVLKDAVDNNKVGALTKVKIVAKLGQWTVLAATVGLNNYEELVKTEAEE